MTTNKKKDKFVQENASRCLIKYEAANNNVQGFKQTNTVKLLQALEVHISKSPICINNLQGGSYNGETKNHSPI
jgi:hypothetical protein